MQVLNRGGSRFSGIDRLVVVLLVVVGILDGWLNYHASDDVQAVALALLVAAGAFCFWRPRLTWLVVPALWIAIPISGIVADANNYHPGLLKPHPIYESLVALIPTVIGAAIGAGARWLIDSERG